MTTSIKILKSIKPPLRWLPVQGEFTMQFLTSKSSDPNGPTLDDLTKSPDSVLHEAQRILGRCLPPNDPPYPETGLVVGYVQSGKTMSFETVLSLARDNGYGIVIVLSGTKNNLREQSEERLTKDLGIDEGDDAWYHLSNPSTDAHGTQIENKLAAWKKQPTKKRAVLITVLKHWDRLDKLADLIDGLKIGNVPTLVIDDEGDQASLNNKAAKFARDSLVQTRRAPPMIASQSFGAFYPTTHFLCIRRHRRRIFCWHRPTSSIRVLRNS
jgi:hypothetical protein